MVDDTENKEHFIRCTLTRKDEEPRVVELHIPDDKVDEFYNSDIDIDIIRRVTLVEERSISELQKEK